MSHQYQESMKTCGLCVLLRQLKNLHIYWLIELDLAVILNDSEFFAFGVTDELSLAGKAGLRIDPEGDEGVVLASFANPIADYLSLMVTDLFSSYPCKVAHR